MMHIESTVWVNATGNTFVWLQLMYDDHTCSRNTVAIHI